MAVEGVELENLLAPVAGEVPVGTDPREDFSPNSAYFKLRDARAEARAAERAADADPSLESGLAEGWRTVRTLALKVLGEQAKDLEVASWLTEALTRSDGLAGLAFGATLIDGLAAQFWEFVYPLPDEDGIATKVAPVTGLNGEGGDGTLVQPLRKLPLFRTPDGNDVLLFQYEQSAELPTIADAKRVDARIKAGVKPYDKMEAEARTAGAGHFAGLRRDARAALAAWRAMGETFDRLAGADSPPTSRVGEIVQRILDIADRYAPPETADAADGGTVDAAIAENAAGAETSGPALGSIGARKIATREDALRVLAEIADFFRRTEPQSPLAYTIDDAVRRGRLSWPELLAELVGDEAVRNSILVSLGIKPPAAPE
jgi:type VI secretion system protein ImpA